MGIPKAVLFDLDGVLIDSELLHHRAYELALAPFGVEGIPFELYAEQWSNLGQGVAYAVRTWPGVEATVLRREKDRLFLELLRSEVHLRPGAAEALRSIAGRWPTALATASSREAALHVLERFELSTFFRSVVGREDYANEKPAPDAFLVAAGALGVPPSDCVVIEDSVKGLHAARAAGMRCIAVPNDYTRAGDFREACMRLSGMDALTAEAVERTGSGEPREAYAPLPAISS